MQRNRAKNIKRRFETGKIKRGEPTDFRRMIHHFFAQTRQFLAIENSIKSYITNTVSSDIKKAAIGLPNNPSKLAKKISVHKIFLLQLIIESPRNK